MTSADAYADAVRAGRQPIADIIKDYGAQYAAGMEVLGMQEQLAKAEFGTQMRETVKAARDEFSGLQADLRALDALRQEGIDSSWQVNRQLEYMLENYKLNEGQARLLAEAMERVNLATSDTAKAAAMREVAAAILTAADAGAEISSDMVATARSAVDLYDATVRVESALADANSQTGAWLNTMAGVRGVVAGILSGLNAISGKAIGAAAAQAEIDALRAGESLRDSAHKGNMTRIQLEGAARTKALREELGVRGFIQGVMEQGAAITEANKQKELSVVQEIAREREKDAAGGAGKAAAELKAAQKGFQTIRELLEQDSLFQFAEYERRQAQLDAALSKRLLSEQAYQTMRGQLQDFYFGTDWEKQVLQYEMEQQALKEALDRKYLIEAEYQERLRILRQTEQDQSLGYYSSFFGNMATIAEAGGRKTLGIFKAFSIAEGMLNAYRSYLHVLADPLLMGRPFLRQALAASTLAAGVAQVANMRRVGGGGGGGGSVGTSGSAGVTSDSTALDTPLRVSADAFDPAQLYTGEAVQKWFDAIQAEAGNRGITWVPV